MNVFGLQVTDITDAIGAVREAGGTLKDGITIAKKVRDHLRGAPDASKQDEIAGLLASLSEKLGDVQIAHFELVDRLHQAETALRSAQAKYDEAQRYELAQLTGGAIALALKEEYANQEPAHYLCQACFDDGKKRILQPLGHSETTLQCPGCKHTYVHNRGGNGGRVAAFRPTFSGI